MSTTRKLRLGPLPKAESIKLTFACPVALKADLDRYAALHAQTYGGTVDATTLIPHMLEALMAGDRGFKKGDLRRSRPPAPAGPGKLIIVAAPICVVYEEGRVPFDSATAMYAAPADRSSQGRDSEARTRCATTQAIAWRESDGACGFA